MEATAATNERERGGGGFGALLMLILAPIAATVIQLWVSRTREYEADATGARETGNPYALARALQKLDDYSRRIPMQASPTTAHLFIVAPLLGSGGFANLFSTHPPIKSGYGGSLEGTWFSAGNYSAVFASAGDGGMGWRTCFLCVCNGSDHFHRLPSAHEAGLVVGGTLPILHWIGLVGGVVFYVAAGILWLRAEVMARAIFALQMMLAGIMLAVTASDPEPKVAITVGA